MSKEKEAVIEKETENKKRSGRQKVLTIVGIILCVILVPILVVNVTMIVKSYTNPDKYPSFLGYNLMIVLSPSMEETINPGDLILVKNAEPAEVQGESAAGSRDGDIISFFDPESEKQSVLTHRCVKVNSDGTFTTKGDNNISEDLTPCPPDNLIGKYITRIPGAGNIAMWLQTTPGLIVCVAVPIVLLVAYDLIMKKRYDKTKKKDTDALLAELESLRAQQAEGEASEQAKADASEQEAAQAQAEKKPDQPEKKPEPDDSSEEEQADEPKEDEKPSVKEEEKTSEKAEEKPAEKADEKPAETAEDNPAEKADEKPAGDTVTATMSAEELEQFRQFQEFQRMQKEMKKSDSADKE